MERAHLATGTQEKNHPRTLGRLHPVRKQPRRPQRYVEETLSWQRNTLKPKGKVLSLQISISHLDEESL